MRVKNKIIGLFTGISLLYFSQPYLNPKNNSINDKREFTEQIVEQTLESRPRLTLEELCDTPIEERDLFLHVYVEEEDKNQARKFYEEKVFSRVTDFFKQHKINCIIDFQDEPLADMNNYDETSIEIYLSQRSYVDRYKTLIESNEDNPDDIMATSGMALTKKNIGLFDASSKCYFIRGAQIPVFSWIETDSKVINRLVSKDSHTISHEILHNLGLFHTFQCRKYFPESEEPNIMSYNPPDFDEYPVVGGFITDEQIKIIHSRLAGNCTYTTMQENSFSGYRELVCDN